MMTKLTLALTAGNTAVVKLPPTVPLAPLPFGAAVPGAGPASGWAGGEQSGQVLPIFGDDAIDDAVAAANATDFGLTASVWTGDDALADKVTGQLIAGTVSVNCHGMAAQDPRVPFGGVGQSGLGRELGADGVRAFTPPRGYVRRPAPR